MAQLGFRAALKAIYGPLGFVPRLQTYAGKEVPNPLSTEVTHGRASISWVLQDALALTKLNYDACIFADGKPVTLKFCGPCRRDIDSRPNWNRHAASALQVLYLTGQAMVNLGKAICWEQIVAQCQYTT